MSSKTLVLSLAVAAPGGRAAAQTQESAMTTAMPPIGELFVLPETSEPAIDTLLRALEDAYDAMDVDRWVALFTEDVEQVDVPRGVHVVGRDAWRAQTVRVNASHVSMRRVHRGRARVGRWVVVEIEWSGVVRGGALGRPGLDRAYRYSGIALLELVGGKVRRQIIYGDVTTLSRQLRDGA